MGKSKRLLKEHERAVEEMAAHLVAVEEMAFDGPLSIAEVVGNLEAAKYAILSVAHDELFADDEDGECPLDGLLDAIFGKEGGDEA